MSIYEPASALWTSRMLSVFRIVAGLIFFLTGSMKVLGYPEFPMPDAPAIEPWSQMWIGGWLEVIGGALIILGLLTRPTAFILAGEMAVAYFQFHQPQAFWPTNNGGVAAVMYCFFFLYLVFAGAGAWSLDAVIARRRASAPASAEGALRTAHA